MADGHQFLTASGASALRLRCWITLEHSERGAIPDLSSAENMLKDLLLP